MTRSTSDIGLEALVADPTGTWAVAVGALACAGIGIASARRTVRYAFGDRLKVPMVVKHWASSSPRDPSLGRLTPFLVLQNFGRGWRQGCCENCGVPVADPACAEYGYLLADGIWSAAMKGLGLSSLNRLFLCIGCVEKGLGRPCTHVDFDWSIPINYSDDMMRSPRLEEAMTRGLPPGTTPWRWWRPSNWEGPQP